MDRHPIVAGQFYPGQPEALAELVREYLDAAQPGKTQAILTMAPHAGYVYSGAVAGRTLGAAGLAERVVLLGPNHTGYGKPLAVWPDGAWRFPGGSLDVESELARLIMSQEPGFEPDYEAHLGEHSLEVQLPFLWALNPETRIVPVSVSLRGQDGLIAAGRKLGLALKRYAEPVSLVVSSDMSHYLSQAKTKEQDALAIEAMLGLDPGGLYRVVRERAISMCGVLPMTLALAAALELGASRAELAAYATSGEASGDFNRVVGYAGIIVS